MVSVHSCSMHCQTDLKLFFHKLSLTNKILSQAFRCPKVNGIIIATEVFLFQVEALYSFTESQDHRMLEVGRDHKRSSSSICLLNQGHLKHITQGCVQMALEYPCRRRLHSLSGQPIPMLSSVVRHHHSTRADITVTLKIRHSIQFLPTSDVNYFSNKCQN